MIGWESLEGRTGYGDGQDMVSIDFFSRFMLLLFLTGAHTGYVEPEVSVTARAGEAPTPRLGRPLH